MDVDFPVHRVEMRLHRDLSRRLLPAIWRSDCSHVRPGLRSESMFSQWESNDMGRHIIASSAHETMAPRIAGRLFFLRSSSLARLAIRVPGDGFHALEVAAALREMGGVEMERGSAWVYAMPSAADRDGALDSVRGRFGWTSAEPA